MVPLHIVPDLTLASCPWGAPGNVAEVAPLDIQELPDSIKVISFAEIVLEDTLRVKISCQCSKSTCTVWQEHLTSLDSKSCSQLRWQLRIEASSIEAGFVRADLVLHQVLKPVLLHAGCIILPLPDVHAVVEEVTGICSRQPPCSIHYPAATSLAGVILNARVSPSLIVPVYQW